MKILIVLVLSFVQANCKIYPECNGTPHHSYVASSKENSGRSFVFCDGENSFEGSCGAGFRFDAVSSTCVSDENTKLHLKNSHQTYSEKRSARAITKLLPTPPGRTIKTTLSNSPTRLTPNRPIPTRKPNKPPTPKNTPIPTVTTQRSPRTTRISNKNSSSVKTKSPVFVPTPPGAQSGSYQTKGEVLTTLSKETAFTTKSYSKTKTPTTPRTPKSTTYTPPSTTPEESEPELTTSSTDTNELVSSIQEECNRKKAGSFADPNDCRNYYRCLKGVLNKQECPKGFGWDARAKTCTSKGCSK